MKKMIAAGVAAVTLLGGQAQVHVQPENLRKIQNRLERLTQQACGIYRRTSYVQINIDSRNPRFNNVDARKTPLASPAYGVCTTPSRTTGEGATPYQMADNVDYLLRVVDANTILIDVGHEAYNGHNYIMAYSGQIPDPDMVRRGKPFKGNITALGKYTDQLEQLACRLDVRTELVETFDQPARITLRGGYKPAGRAILSKEGIIRNPAKVCGHLELK